MFKQKPYPRPPKPTYTALKAVNIARVADEVRAVEKTEAHRNRDLLDLARGQECLLAIPGVCKNDRETTVAAHSNWHEHGKSGARKADDQFTVWACSRCHSWLDSSYSATIEDKKAAFYAAHVDQIAAWWVIAHTSKFKKARDAASWALKLLGES